MRTFASFEWLAAGETMPTCNPTCPETTSGELRAAYAKYLAGR